MNIFFQTLLRGAVPAMELPLLHLANCRPLQSGCIDGTHFHCNWMVFLVVIVVVSIAAEWRTDTFFVRWLSMAFSARRCNCTARNKWKVQPLWWRGCHLCFYRKKDPEKKGRRQKKTRTRKKTVKNAFNDFAFKVEGEGLFFTRLMTRRHISRPVTIRRGHFLLLCLLFTEKIFPSYS